MKISIIQTNVPFEFEKLQYLICLAFAITIKSQDQSLKDGGMNLEISIFPLLSLNFQNQRFISSEVALNSRVQLVLNIYKESFLRYRNHKNWSVTTEQWNRLIHSPMKFQVSRSHCIEDI